MPVGCFLKNIIYGLHTVNSKAAIWGEDSSSCQREKKRQEIFLGKIGHFTHKGINYILPHVLYSRD